MPTSYSTRTPISTSYSLTRLGGAYLTDVSGNYITTAAGERIILIIPGGSLSLTVWTGRTTI